MIHATKIANVSETSKKIVMFFGAAAEKCNKVTLTDI